MVAIKPRRANLRSIVRLASVSHTAPELFYLRRILLHQPVRSFKDSKGSFQTFQEAAIAKGYVNMIEVFAILDELIDVSTPRSIRNIYVTLTIDGYPTLKIIKANPSLPEYKYYVAMTSDFRRNNGNESRIRQDLLISFDNSFKARGMCVIFILCTTLYIEVSIIIYSRLCPYILYIHI